MKSFLFSSLALGALSLINAHSSSKFHEFVADLELLTGVDADAIAAVCSPRGSDQSCQVLKLLFPHDTNLPSEVDAYHAKVSISWCVITSPPPCIYIAILTWRLYNRSTRARLNSTCIFSPTTTQATVVGVKVAKFFNTQFAIRSGGHTPDPGPASTSEGILFSLENLNQIDLDTTNNIAFIGPGNRWGDVYVNLEAKGFLVTGGRVSPVGVGGLLTGGLCPV